MAKLLLSDESNNLKPLFDQIGHREREILQNRQRRAIAGIELDRESAYVTGQVLTLDGGLPGQAPALPPQRRRFLDELGRWLSAYLSGQIRDQLLLSGRYCT